jgi:3-oxoacyl-[acyl-carrier protein] reductase
MREYAVEDQTVLITGAGKGVGKALTSMFLEEKCNVIAFTRSEADVIKMGDEFAEYGDRLLAIQGDVSDAEDAERAVGEAAARFGTVDILINNAGIGRYGPLEDLGVQDYDDMMNTNMRGTFLFSKLVAPIMKRKQYGHIISISSVAGKKGLPNETVYCATKFAQVGFAQALDYELRPFGIKVSSVCPGGIDTHFAIGTGRTEGDPRLSEFLDAEDVAEAVRFIVSQGPKSRIIEMILRPMGEPI